MSKELEVINAPIITLEKQAVVDFSNIDNIFASVKAEIEALNINEIEATDDNKKKLVDIRVRLNKDIKEYEDDRKFVFGVIDEPKALFKEKYDPMLAYLKDVVDTVKVAVDSIDDKQKQLKRVEVEEYFSDLKVDYTHRLLDKNVHINFITFDDMELNITLSVTAKKLKEEIDAKLEHHYNNLIVIDGNDNMARVFADYQQTKDLARSLQNVQDAIKREEEILNTAKPIEVKEVKETPAPNVVEEIIKVTFELTDTKANIIKVRDFMKQNKINYKGV